ncbi:VOC family protein [Bacillus cytotoxicus]|uniref:VOC family protein n=1 Tax=Bacillus cytotoxicus TaxID=580165 RepID=UPI0008641E7E|nr:VOC family protein [Bacillus cytotoxicus]AWC28759.1 lactoylglutathione lyase [Bacillus cytotoxicus]AWC39858.1 lactoylglutathione lyase [Bacillus cytotoxicus]AWC47789.1 lactoylglutathione lyase [Bacillus cytotoxicus]AWC52826.1 lactoylglutathione lyase [Bacillus cytotoxicus]AWC56958.1 lactoylglutathione lyase [Bacillus cytotoxicus]
MHFRLELFVEDLERSIRFYEGILGLTFFRKNETGAMVKLEDFALLLTPDYILDKNHYLKKGGLTPKGKGVEVIIVFDNIEQLYQHVLEKNYPVKSSLKTQPWGMKDFRIIDPDGYYLRLTSY